MAQGQQNSRIIATASLLKDIYAEWKPHPKQAQILKAVFYDKVKDVKVWAGRKGGKTELIMDVLRRFALTHPNSSNYYIAPEQKQAREILWATNRLQKFIPKKYIKSINNGHMRITLKNGSFIKLDGADNHESYRGVEPHCLVYDEFKDHHPMFHIAMDPNRAVYNAPLVIIGTPPEIEGQDTAITEQYKNDPNKRFFHFTSFENPYISRDWLHAKKDELYSKGEEDVWEREYMAKFVRGGKNAIFPMLDESVHFSTHLCIENEIKRDKHKLEWYVTADPGTTSCFAVLFAALNPYTKKWYIVDEIYELDQKETSTAKILARVDEIRAIYNYSGDWRYTYDEAAAWFARESSALNGPGWGKCNKDAMKRDPSTKEPWGVSVIKDILNQKKIAISDRCPNLKNEMLNYVRTFTRNGDVKVLKRNDHLIDCFRYTIHRAAYRLPTLSEPPGEKKWLPGKRRKVYTLEDDFGGEIPSDEDEWGYY